MDPLSVTASVLAVLTVVKASLQGISGYRKANQELDSLISELDRVQEIIQTIYTYFTSHHKAPFTEHLVKSIRSILSKLEHIQRSRLPARSLQRLSTSNQKRVTWFLKKRTLIALRDDLRALRSDLHLQISFIDRYVGANSASNLISPVKKHGVGAE